MLTKCPSCSTAFRVVPAQLKVRSGTVRCGQCNFIFNALETLADDPINVLAETAAMPPPPEPSMASEVAHEPMPEPAEEASFEPTAEALPEPVPEPAEEVSHEPTPEPATEAAHEPTPELAAEAAPQQEDYLADSLLHELTAKPRRWPWVLGSIVALLGLLLQAVYYYRIELAVVRPDLRPLLQAACKPLNCDVPRPRSIDTLGIDTSDLRPDPQHPGHLTLTATLRSKAVYAQEWPMLELTLTDVADRGLAVKHFAASDYLPKDKDNGSKRIAAGFPANGEIAIALSLDVGDMPASGYRLYIFYP